MDAGFIVDVGLDRGGTFICFIDGGRGGRGGIY